MRSLHKEANIIINDTLNIYFSYFGDFRFVYDMIFSKDQITNYLSLYVSIINSIIFVNCTIIQLVLAMH